VFVVADGVVLVEEGINVLLVRGRMIAGQQDGAAGEPGFDGVQRGFGFALGRGGPGTELGVGAVGIDLCVGSHGFEVSSERTVQDGAAGLRCGYR
jgi:hypothetical protein